MQKLPIAILAEWDPDALVWVATSDDIGGFVMEDATLERLVSRVPAVLEDLIELNNLELPANVSEVPFEVRTLQTGFALAHRA